MTRSAVTCEHCGRHGVPRLVNGGTEVCLGCARDIDRLPAKEVWVSAEEELAPAVLAALNAPGGRRMTSSDVCRALGRKTNNRTVRKALDLLAEQSLVNRDSRKRWGRLRGTGPLGEFGPGTHAHTRAHSADRGSS
jgi:hypothetical protein